MLLLLVSVGAFAYGRYQYYQFQQELPSMMERLYQATESSSALDNPSPTDTVAPPAPLASATPTIEGSPTATVDTKTPSPTTPPSPTITATPSASATASPTIAGPDGSLPPVRIVIPAIDVDSPVLPAKFERGEWQVPKFVVGHLEGTANPGPTGNVALSGHLQSTASGNVFARLSEMKVGQLVTLYTTRQDKTVYKVAEVKMVRNTDVTVVEPTTKPRLTLITCAGDWVQYSPNYGDGDYSHRVIVVAEPFLLGQTP